MCFTAQQSESFFMFFPALERKDYNNDTTPRTQAKPQWCKHRENGKFMFTLRRGLSFLLHWLMQYLALLDIIRLLFHFFVFLMAWLFLLCFQELQQGGISANTRDALILCHRAVFLSPCAGRTRGDAKPATRLSRSRWGKHIQHQLMFNHVISNKWAADSGCRRLAGKQNHESVFN